MRGNNGRVHHARHHLRLTPSAPLAMDAVQKANSGTPRAPRWVLRRAYVLWNRVMNYDPAGPAVAEPRPLRAVQPEHASMLLYSLISPDANSRLADLHHARFWRRPVAVRWTNCSSSGNSVAKRPGHPESDLTAGVETTTGPLGTGVGNAVGMAIARSGGPPTTAAPDSKLFDHRVYAICGDGVHDGRRRERSLVARRAPEAEQPHAHLRRQRASPSTATRTWPSVRTCPSGSKPTAGTYHPRECDGNDLAAIGEGD